MINKHIISNQNISPLIFIYLTGKSHQLWMMEIRLEPAPFMLLKWLGWCHTSSNTGASANPNTDPCLVFVNYMHSW
ncbi:hypothetical protein DsansV1_C16g0140781 [Dioscorea sansibarensis]